MVQTGIKSDPSKMSGASAEYFKMIDASNRGVPTIHSHGSAVAEAYKDVVRRFLGESREMRFMQAERPTFFQRLFARGA